MAWKYNPFTDALDKVGSSGGSYIDGEVEYHADLPVTVGTPTIDSAFLVRKGSGFYFLTRKPAGIWVRELNNGNLDDWKYAGTFSDLYRDANFRIINDADTSKELAFSLSGITTGTTRTLTVPNSSGTISLSGHTHIASDIVFGQFANNRINWASPDAIGSSVPSTGDFTTLTAATSLVVKDGSDTGTFVAASKLTANRTYDLPDRSGTMVVSDTTAGTGSDVVNNIVSLTQAEYNAIGSPDAATLFLITDP